MSTLGWNKRPSNTKRISYSQFLNELGANRQSRQSRSVERQSRIPLRASGQSGRDKVPQNQNKPRSKSAIPASSETPLSHVKITPSHHNFGLRITPGASSNISSKKTTFIKDPRNLQDKEFLKEASQVVQNYFQEKCPEILINNVDIKPMTIKMFIAMVNHLFEALGILDKGIEPVRFAVSTYEKELPYWMKKLEYPGLITKAWLQTVNVPQYWPNVVGLLSWLVKLCIVNSMFNMEEQLNIEHKCVKKDWAIFFFKKSLEAFRAYNEGKEEEETQKLFAEVLQKFRSTNGIEDGVLEELQNDIAELKHKIEDPVFLKEKDAHDEAEQQLRVLQSLNEKKKEDITKKEMNIVSLKDKIAKKKRNCAFIEEQIESTKQEVESLKLAVSAQSMSVQDIAGIMKKTEYLDKEIKCLEKECEDYTQLISKYELESAGVRDKILQSSHAFNRRIIQLEQMIPELKRFHIYMDPDDEGIIEEMESMVKDLEALKNSYLEKNKKLEEEILECEKEIMVNKERVKEMMVAIKNQEKKNEAKKKKNMKLQKNSEEKEKSLKEELEKWGEKNKSLEEKIKELDGLKRKKEELKSRYETLSKALQKKQLFWNEFWTKVNECWKHIPYNLELLLEKVNSQNK